MRNLHKIKKSCTKIEAFAQKTDIVPIWKLPNYKLISLLDMLQFYAKRFARLITLLSSVDLALRDVDPNDKPTKEDLKQLLLWVHQAKKISVDIGLQVSVKQFNRIKTLIEMGNLTPSNCAELFVAVHRVVLDEMESVLLLKVNSNRVSYYQETELFGNKVFNKFSSANFDIEEAGKCFALARYTACVMHLMRCLEVALRAIGIALNVNLSNPNWGNIINQANSAINANKSSLGVAWKAEEDFYTNAIAHFSTVKNAWRNPTMHIERKYTEEEAEDIFNAVKGLMRHIAKHLDEKGNFTP